MSNTVFWSPLLRGAPSSEDHRVSHHMWLIIFTHFGKRSKRFPFTRTAAHSGRFNRSSILDQVCSFYCTANTAHNGHPQWPPQILSTSAKTAASQSNTLHNQPTRPQDLKARPPPRPLHALHNARARARRGRPADSEDARPGAHRVQGRCDGDAGYAEFARRRNIWAKDGT